jgi:beta-glucosidase
MGRIVANIIIKEGLKTAKEMKSEWMVEVAKKTMMETPLHMLALFSSGKFTFEQAEGLVDMMNLKVFRGIRKLKKGAKK